MTQSTQQSLPVLVHNQVKLLDREIALDSAAWYEWLSEYDTKSFSWPHSQGTITIRRELKRNQPYWYAYLKQHGKLRKAYLGKSQELSSERLKQVAERLLGSSVTPQQLRINLLGRPEIMLNGQLQTGLTNKAIACLAYLAARRAPQHRDHLLALLWPESNTAAAQKNLRNLLWSIKSLLGNDVFVIEQDTISLNPQIEIDLKHFSHACHSDPHQSCEAVRESLNPSQIEDTVKLYRGRFLEGIEFDYEAELDLWLSTESEHLHQRFVMLIWLLLDYHKTTEQWHRVIRLTQHALKFEPSNEPFYALQMEAWARLGDRAAALRVYKLLCTILRKELDMRPMPSTEDLRLQIIRGQVLPLAAQLTTNSLQPILNKVPV
jgi:DNA-binding SARP family transcriptional activator